MSEFWEKLEADLDCPIPNFIKNGFTMAGYAHPIAFKAITDEHISRTEQFIREKTFNIVHQNLHDSISEKKCEVLVDDELMRDYFGNLYAEDPASFEFEAGDVLLIKELVEHVKSVADRNGKNTGLGHFAKPKAKARRAVAKKSRQRVNTAHLFPEKKKKKVTAQIDENQLKIELQEKAMTCFNLHMAGTDNSQVTIDQVKVELSKKNGIIGGLVWCVICGENEKPKRMFHKSSKASGGWVLSNLTKHLENVHHLHARVNTLDLSLAGQHSVHGDMNKFNPIFDSTQNTDSTELIVENTDGIADEVKKENVDENTAESANEDASLKIIAAEFPSNRLIKHDDSEQLYKQISSQITKVTAAVLKNGDETEKITFTLNKSPRKLSVVIIPGDGSCLFGALAHQLWMHKIGSRNQIKATKTLRENVVKHILDNFPFFERYLEDRVYEIKHKKEITDLAMECKLFARYGLSNHKTWGGVETMMAVSNLYQTNVVVFNEEGTCTKYKKCDEIYERSIVIAQRLGLNENGEPIRNHFDSVFEATEADLYAAARYIAK